MHLTNISHSGEILQADAIIVGSGAGGACVADVLTRAGLSVLMFEEGAYVPTDKAPKTPSEAMALTWRHAGLSAAFGKPPIAYGEGRCVGGGTEINSAIFQRPPEQLIEDWERLYKIEAFSPQSLTPFLERAEAVVNASLTRGSLGRPSDILTEGSKALGWKTSELKRGQRSCVGTNMCSFVCPTGGKQSMTNTLLPQAQARGLKMFANARVTRLLLDGKKITGITGQFSEGANRTPFTAKANVVFLCAGAIHTPTLLQRSGIRGLIGQTLQLHPTIKVIAEWEDEINAHLYRLPLVAITEFMPDQRIGGSIFSPATFALSLAEDWQNRMDLLSRWRHCGLYYGMIRPRGLGKIKIIRGIRDPFVTYQLAPEDWQSLKSVTYKLGQAMFAAGAKRVIPSIVGHKGWNSLQDLSNFNALSPRMTNLMTIHLFSSCRGGEDTSACAVDSFGRVRGFENLVVADASLIPEALGVNPQAMVMALAFRAAEAWLTHSSRSLRHLAAREQQTQ